MSTRLPVVGSDDGNWGTILNAFLQVGHDASGNNIGIVVETSKGTNYTLAPADSGYRLVATAAITITLPTVGTLGNGFEAEIVNDSGGTVTIVVPGASNASLNNGDIVLVLETNSKQKVTFLYSTGQQFFPQATLTDGASIAWNLNTQQAGIVTLGGNRTLANPTNMQAGSTYTLIVKQDATGSRTLAYGSNYKWPGGTTPTLTAGANGVDILTFISDGSKMYGVAAANFS
jgi:hypothetical protein